jgi:hypothetical protein
MRALRQAVTLYAPVEHRPLAMRFGQDVRVAALWSWALWFLGYPDAALADADQALHDAREIGHAASRLVDALYICAVPPPRVSRIRAEKDVRQLKPSRIGMCERADGFEQHRHAFLGLLDAALDGGHDIVRDARYTL